jgi:TPR repeat protein
LAYPSHLEYPDEAKRKLQSGNVYMEFTAAPDGSARNPRVIYAVPNGLFDAMARTATLHAQFPAGADAVHCNFMFHFKMDGSVVYPELQSFAEKTLKNANDGDPNAQLLYGLMLGGLPQLGKSYKDALPWFLKAAQNGQVAAQYQVGSSLLFGNGCQCETNKAEVWLKRAAEAGQPDAQVTLGVYALRGEPSAADMRISKIWLERAVAAGNPDAMYYLAGLLAAAPDEQIRDPVRAQHLLEQLKRDRDGNPSILEIRAAAEASAGDFAAAKFTELDAINQARRLKWDLAPLNERLARYQSKQPWYGNLLIL